MVGLWLKAALQNASPTISIKVGWLVLTADIVSLLIRAVHGYFSDSVCIGEIETRNRSLKNEKIRLLCLWAERETAIKILLLMLFSPPGSSSGLISNWFIRFTSHLP